MTGLSPDLASMLDQLAEVDEQRRRMVDLQEVLIDQVTWCAGVHWKAGRMGREELVEFYSRVRDLGEVGFRAWWDAAGLPDIRKIRAQIRREAAGQPSEADGSWAGTLPIADQRRPPNGQAVVYLLFDGADPVYLGSTDQMMSRLSGHVHDGKRFTSWRAWPCRDREDAYRREVEMLRGCLPRLNVRAGR